jgi:hypothetical protein
MRGTTVCRRNFSIGVRKSTSNTCPSCGAEPTDDQLSNAPPPEALERGCSYAYGRLVVMEALPAMFETISRLFGQSEAASAHPLEPRLAVAAILVHLAAVDGQAKPEEYAVIANALKDHYGLGDADVKKLVTEAKRKDVHALQARRERARRDRADDVAGGVHRRRQPRARRQHGLARCRIDRRLGAGSHDPAQPDPAWRGALNRKRRLIRILRLRCVSICDDVGM